MTSGMRRRRSALVVAVDDYVGLREPNDAATLDAFVRAELLPQLIEQTPFVLVAFEGGRELHLEYVLR